MYTFAFHYSDKITFLTQEHFLPYRMMWLITLFQNQTYKHDKRAFITAYIWH